MRFLLDTHALLWWLDGDRRLGRRARSVIADEDSIAQAQTDDLSLISDERVFDSYGVRRVW